jgi:hypothetical protein
VIRRQGGTADITQLILDDHHEQRRLFAILEQIDRAETEVLSAVWDRLASYVREAEEDGQAPRGGSLSIGSLKRQ